MIRINNLKANEDYTLLINFENVETKLFDVKPYLNLEVFEELKDKKYFMAVGNFKYYIAWSNEQDLSCDTLYFESKRTVS
jgi:hypothetical protein